MPRPPRASHPTGPFHVMSRATEGARLFLRDADHRMYLGLLDATASRHAWSVSTFVLMPNHVHLLVGGEPERLSHGFWWLHWRYAEYFKRAYDPRLGHVFGGRPKMKPIKTDAYFFAVLRYIALNPVGVLAHRADEYRWSAHRALVGRAPAIPFLADLRAWFGGSLDGYADLVASGEPDEHAAVRRWSADPPGDRPALHDLVADPTPIALAEAHGWDYTIREISASTGLSTGCVHARIARARP